MFFFVRRSCTWILCVYTSRQHVLHDYVCYKCDFTLSGNYIFARAAQMANIITATTAFGHQLAAGLFRHETCCHDNTNVDKAETQSWQIASVVAPARDVFIYVPERREIQDPDVHFTNV